MPGLPVHLRRPRRRLRAASLVSAALLSLVSAAPAAAGTISLYPDSKDALNPRVPVIAPAAGGRSGLGAPFETRFTYAFGPRLAFPEGGRLRVALRDNPRRQAKDAIALVSGRDRLVLRIASAAEGRGGSVVHIHDGRPAGTLTFPRPSTTGWTDLELEWTGGELRARVDGRDIGRLPLAAAFSPGSVSLETWHVDELSLAGDGSLSLGWENGYAATLVPAKKVAPANPAATSARLFGFDAFAVGSDPAKRDFPMLQLLNAGSAPAEATFRFSLRSEISGASRSWSQTVSAAPRSDTWTPLAFPAPLGSDIHHLDVTVEGAALEGAAARHFFTVERRAEAAGPPKFGLHDANEKTFGSWPDALPIHLMHVYARWGYIVGPAWIRDYDGAPGVDPATPPEEWYWNRRLDWALGQNLTPYVCLESTPLLDWQREREIPGKMRKRDWGLTGGLPDLERYRHFVRALAERYRGRVPFYEVENEPNSSHSGLTPQDYVRIVRAVHESVRAADPAAKVYGISGTANFVPFAEKVFAAGGAGYLDGVSIHTYVTPQLPEQANLAGKLDDLKAAIAKTGRPLSIVNSETGTYVALREKVDEPISPGRLAELIKAGTPTLAVPKGWPNNAQDERRGAISIVRNATYNFLAGVERFVFFGWNPEWPNGDWTSRMTRPGGGFALLSSTPEGVRTPSLQTLAVGVFTAQMEGVLPGTGRAWAEAGVHGGAFAKANGGELAVLWSDLGRRSVLIESDEPELELVGLHGQRRVSSSATATATAAGSGAGARHLHALELDAEPLYLHARRPGLRLVPSPVLNVASAPLAGGGVEARFTLVNRSTRPWTGRVAFSAPAGWTLDPASRPFSLAPSERIDVSTTIAPPPDAGRRAHAVEASFRLADGTPFSLPIPVELRSVFAVPALPGALSLRELADWAMPGGPLRLDQPEQAVIGRPPALTSIQGDHYWQGSAELSAIAKVGHDSRGLHVYVEATDAHARPPAPWPGVKGSCVEVFLDLRRPESGLGAAYGPGAWQLLLKPSLSVEGEVEVFNASEKSGPLPGAVATGGPRPGGYWLALHVPWDSLGRRPAPGETFGFDLGLDGPQPTGSGRKTQLMLFGTAANSSEPARFGLGLIAAPKP